MTVCAYKKVCERRSSPARSLLDSKRFNHAHMHSAAQLTDLYLLALAVKHAGRLVSFDRRIPLSAVMGAGAAHMVVL